MIEPKKCSIEGCKRPYRAKGYCDVHFKKWRAGEIEGHRPRYKICKEENCKKPMFKKGMCEQHYGAWSASKKGAPAEGQTSPANAAKAPEGAKAEETTLDEGPKAPVTAPTT